MERKSWARSVSGRGEELLRRLDLHDLARVHEDHPVGHAAGEPHLVGDHHHGHALLGEVGHDLEHLVDHLRIQRGGRLVEKHDLRLHGQGAGDGHALLLAAGEIGGILVRLVGNAHALEQDARDLLRLGGRQPLHLGRRQRDVLQHRHVREEVEGLEDHAHLGAEPREVHVGRGDALAVHQDLALLDGLEPIDAADEGALAGAGRPAHHDDLAPRHRQAHVIEHVEGARTTCRRE